MAEWIVEADEMEHIIEGWFTIGTELVRCKDCKSYRFYDGAFGKGWICFKTNNKRSADDFCSRGERDEDALG